VARHVHGLLLRASPPDARCPACGGAGYVRGEPCLACA
jgi:DnaJ-class molecular chaperone